MAADGGDCEKVLAEFAKAGINVDALAAQLQDEGAKSFVKSWNELLAVIASKSDALKQAAHQSTVGFYPIAKPPARAHS
jgi:transaldolase